MVLFPAWMFLWIYRQAKYGKSLCFSLLCLWFFKTVGLNLEFYFSSFAFDFTYGRSATEVRSIWHEMREASRQCRRSVTGWCSGLSFMSFFHESLFPIIFYLLVLFSLLISSVSDALYCISISYCFNSFLITLKCKHAYRCENHYTD